MTRIIALSDTHRIHDHIHLPEGDILIHAGDFTMRGKDDEVEAFANWLEQQKDKYKHRIIIAGNHDFLFQHYPSHALLYFDPGVIYLEDSKVDIDGLRIYGSPYSNMFHNWAFMEEDDELAKRWEMINDNTDILITHGPAYSILDKVRRGEHVGSKSLYNRIKQLKNLKIHICGHIHEAHGQETIDNVRFYNVSILNDYYRMHNAVTVIEV